MRRRKQQKPVSRNAYIFGIVSRHAGNASIRAYHAWMFLYRSSGSLAAAA